MPARQIDGWIDRQIDTQIVWNIPSIWKETACIVGYEGFKKLTEANIKMRGRYRQIDRQINSMELSIN